MPTSSRPYQDNFRKKAKTDNVFQQPKDMVKHEALVGDRKERMKRWITFFRRNPVRLIQTYFGIHLYPFQILMIWVLQRSNLAYIVASRAASKTFIIAIWALVLAVLYPGIQIVAVSKTLKQGSLILGKMTQLRDNYPNVAREIRTITTNANTNECIFNCGSTIKVVPSSESARGNRANYIIIEESRLVPKDILEQIIKPFLFSRVPPYRLKQEYMNDPDLKEEGIISYITSAWYTAEYWYSMVKSCIKRMINGDTTSNFLAFDYLITIYHNIKTKEMIKNEMQDADPITIQMEYFNIPAGSSSQSYFKPSQFSRTIKRAFYPQREITYNPKKNPYEIKKVDGGLKFVSIDVATRAGRANDLTIVSSINLVPIMGKGFERQLVHMEAFKGLNTLLQAKRIKEVFYDFEADFIVLDLMNAGIGVFDSLSQNTVHDERGITYPPMTVVDDEFVDKDLREELKERTLGLNPLPVIYPIRATQAGNSSMYASFRNSLQKKMWKFLIPEGDAEEWLIRNNKEFISDSNDSDTYGFFMSPYLNTGFFISECVNLDMSLVSGMIKLTEKPGCYKDRFSSVLYGNWIISSVFDKLLLKETQEIDDWSAIQAVTFIL